MARYVIKVNGIYVSHVGEDSIDLVKELPRYGLTDNLRQAEKQLGYVKSLMGLEGKILVQKTSITKKVVKVDEIDDLDNTEGKYYILENDRNQAVKGIEDTGDIQLSFQQCYKMCKVYQVDRVMSRLDEYGLKGYQLKEVTVQTVTEEIETYTK